MKLRRVLYFSLCFSFIGFSQEKLGKSEVMATITCECLENQSSKKLAKDFQKEFDDCFTASVLGALLSTIPADEDSTITINTDGTYDSVGEKEKEKAFKLLEENCEVFKNVKTSSTERNVKLDVVADASCRCIGTIPTSLEITQKNQAIQQCITGSVSDLREELSINNNTVEEIKDFYSNVYAMLVDNCEAISIVTFSDNQEKLYSYSGNDKAMGFYEKGQDYYTDKKFKKAIKFYELAIKEDPKFVFAWDNLGRVYREIDKYDKAITAYKNSIAVDSLNRTSLMNIAVAYNYKKEFNQSEKWYKKLINIDNQDPEGHYGIALSYLYQNKLEESLNSLLNAYKLYEKVGSPYIADAKKVMRYLKQFYVEAGEEEAFTNTLKANNITLD